MGRDNINDYWESILSKFDGVDMSAATCTTTAVKVQNVRGFSIGLKFTGAPVGTFKLRASSDVGSTPTNWEDITGSSKSISAAGSELYNISNVYFAWVQVMYTKTSGTGTITEAHFLGKD